MICCEGFIKHEMTLGIFIMCQCDSGCDWKEYDTMNQSEKWLKYQVNLSPYTQGMQGHRIEVSFLNPGITE